MTATPEQAKEISQWADRNRKMLTENYQLRFVAYSATHLLEFGTDFNQVKSQAEQMGEPFLIEWIPALTAADM